MHQRPPRPSVRRATALAVVALAVALAWACAGGPRPPAGPAPATPPASMAARDARPGAPPSAAPAGAREAPPLARFTVLFRREDPAPLTLRVRDGVLGDEGAAPPVPIDDLAAAVDRAAAAWSAEGLVAVRRVADAVLVPELVVTFARGEHGDCPAFGRDRGVAHVWPADGPSELHLDAGRTWVVGEPPPQEAPNVPRSRSLTATLVHEIGHVFGLGHTPDPDAAMFGDSHRLTPARSDLAGIRSLYGSGADAPGPDDVVLESASGARTRLVDVAPAGASACALADTDADGADELLVWRTDDAGHGILVVYRFDDALALVRTDGPYVGALIAGGELELVELETGLALRSRRDDAILARAFDAAGMPGSPLPIDPEVEDAPPLTGLAKGDVDDDGRADRIAHGPVAGD